MQVPKDSDGKEKSEDSRRGRRGQGQGWQEEEIREKEKKTGNLMSLLKFDDYFTNCLWLTKSFRQDYTNIVTTGKVVEVLMSCIHFESICTICEFSTKFAMNRCGPEIKVMNIP